MSENLLFKRRDKSLMFPSGNLESLHVFKNFPVFIGATDQPPENDLFFDMSWDICTTSGLIQLRDLLDPSLIYSGYHSEAVGGVWLEHHNQFCDFVSKFIGRRILEVGGSNGYVAKRLIQESCEIEKYIIVEPNPNCKSQGRIEVIDTFFDANWAQGFDDRIDTVIHSHTFEHMYDPVEFISSQCRSFNQSN